MNDKKNILVIYNCYPHYRNAIVKTLNSSQNFNFTFAGSNKPHDNSIKLMQFEKNIIFLDANLHSFGPIQYQSGLFPTVARKNYDCVIVLGNPYIISYWVYASILRIRGIPVLFWTHGWINSHENKFKRKIRNLFYRLGNGLLLYGNRAKKIGVSYGFDENRLFVINNSLDFSHMTNTFELAKKTDKVCLKKELGIAESSKIIICSARLIKLCRFDLLIDAASILISRGDTLHLLLIGDGPCREDLQKQAGKLSVPIKFTGACYDELVIAKYYYISDVAVSPGKVGLTAIHSMTYETPVISHNNLDNQMPEVETIIEGKTGSLFEEGDANSLANAIEKILSNNTHTDFAYECKNRIKRYFSPDYQLQVIESAIDLVTT